MKKSLFCVISSVIIGLAFFFLGELLLNGLTKGKSCVFEIGVYFLTFSIVYLFYRVILRVIGFVTHADNMNNGFGSLLGLGFLISIIMVLLSFGFEWIYELGKNNLKEPTSYYFLIDDSGSMQANDANNERIVAVEKIMEEKDADFPYAVYRFDVNANCLKELSKQRMTEEIKLKSDGNTDILNSAKTVLNDLQYQSTLAGDSPRLLILSDGESNDYGRGAFIDRCISSGVAISAVSFGGDSNLLRRLAERTGGAYVRVDNINELKDEMKSAIESQSCRHLLSYRFMKSKDALYCILRLLFLIILGIVWSLMKLVLAETSSEREYAKKVFFISAILCTFAACVMEFITQKTDLNVEYVRAAFCILWAFTPGYFLYEDKTTSGSATGGMVTDHVVNKRNAEGKDDRRIERPDKDNTKNIRRIGGAGSTEGLEFFDESQENADEFFANDVGEYGKGSDSMSEDDSEDPFDDDQSFFSE